MANYPLREQENLIELSTALHENGADYHPRPTPVFAHLLSKAGWYQVFGKGQNNEHLKSMLNLLLTDMMQLKELIHEQIEQYNEETGENENFSEIFCRDAIGIDYVCKKSNRQGNAVYPAGIAFTINRALNFNIPETVLKNRFNPFILFTDMRREDMPREFGLLNLGKCTCEDSSGNFIHQQPLMVVALSIFNKKANRLKTETDKWLFLLKNMDKLEEIPPALDNDYFRPIFEAARFSNLSDDEQEEYLGLDIAF